VLEASNAPGHQKKKSGTGKSLRRQISRSDPDEVADFRDFCPRADPPVSGALFGIVVLSHSTNSSTDALGITHLKIEPG
jgi:hypothetical protein